MAIAKHFCPKLQDSDMPVIQAPDSNTTLWRYMSFKKLQLLLETKSLWLARIDQFKEHFEGAIPHKIALQLEATRAEKGGFPFLSYVYGQRLCAGTNCWHMNNNESAAMWDLYLRDEERRPLENGIAIVSDYQRLLDAIDYEQFERNMNALGGSHITMIIGKVAYIDHFSSDEAKSLNTHKWYFTKNISYDHERELRIYVHSAARFKEKGLQLPVDIHKLASRICFSPTASTAFKEEVQQLMEQYGIELPVTDSSLAPSSFYLTVQPSNAEA